MALTRSISDWQPTGIMIPCAVCEHCPPDSQFSEHPEMQAVYGGDWIYTDAGGNRSVIAIATATQAEAEAVRDAWLAAGATP